MSKNGSQTVLSSWNQPLEECRVERCWKTSRRTHSVGGYIYIYIIYLYRAPMRWLAHEAQVHSGNDANKNRSSKRHGFCCPRRTRWRLLRVSSFEIKSQKSVICEVRTGYGTEVARRSATKEDCCLISVVTFEADRVGSTPAVSCARTLPRCCDDPAD